MKYHRLTYTFVIALSLSCVGEEPGSVPINVTNKKTVIENFESNSFREWTRTGNAFSSSLATEADMSNWGVKGYEGTHIMTSWWPMGDDGIGAMKSPVFTIEQDYFNFLIGGGGDVESTYLALFIDGEEFKREAGCNDWTLEQVSWDVSAFKGKPAYVYVEDSATHAWGFIQFDYIYLSDKPADCKKSRMMSVTGRYLNFPVSYKNNIETIRVYLEGEVVYDIDLRLTDNEPDYWVSMYCGDYIGKEIEVGVMFNSFIHAKTPLVYNNGLKNISNTDIPAENAVFYQDDLRPKAHFSAARGWLNDPNGLYYYDGFWHMSFQHNPFGADWGNIHWGHAFSTDLYHWTETDDILKPDSWGVPFSGYSVIDFDNVTGLREGNDPAILSFYTAAGENGYLSRGEPYTQCLAYSTDGGWNWKRFSGNPVLPFYTTNTRDPQVTWSDEDQCWVMVVFLYDNEYAFFESSNLIEWEEAGHISIPSDWECPDFYKIKVEETNEYYWVLSGVHNIYYVGTFSGGVFSPITTAANQDLNREYLAPHTFTNAPGGRRIQVGCIGNGNFPNLPFNQAISFPKEITLHKSNDGYKLYAKPCKEIENGHSKTKTISKKDVLISTSEQEYMTGGAFHAKAIFDLNQCSATSFGFAMDAFSVLYNTSSKSFSVSGVPLRQTYGANGIVPPDGLLEMEVIYDCSILEVFVNGGEYSVTATFTDSIVNKSIITVANDGSILARQLTIGELEPFWKQ